MEALIESEMLQIESENSPADESPQVEFSGAEELFVKDRTVIDVDYEGENALDLDDDDEKTLLYRQLTFANLSPQ